MKTIIKKINIYEYIELNKEAKEKVMYETANDMIEFSSYEMNDTIYQIKKYLSNIPDVEGVRLYTWIINNLPLSTPKTYYQGGGVGLKKLKKRTSNIIYNFDCPYTGVCYDYIAIDTVNELKRRLKKGYNVTPDEFIRILDDTAEKMINDEYEGMLTDEYTADTCAANEWYFTYDGKLYSQKGA